jgi:probable rRNA maturation factor
VSGIAVEVNNHTRYAVDEAAVEALAAAVLAAEGVAGELGVTFVGEPRMRALNRDYRQVDRATDVLAFPLEEAGEVGAPPAEASAVGVPAPEAGAAAPPRLLGDVVVCPRVAQRQARTHGLPLPLEVAVLLVHGILHVLGHDHGTGAGAMAARQAELLQGLDWESLGVAPR